MYQPIILCIALRYIYGKTINRFSQYIYWISNISIIFSIITIIIILSVMNGFERELKKNILYFIPHAIISATTGYANTNHIPNFLKSNAILNNIEYIKPLVISNVIIQSTQKISLGVMFGINPNYFEPLSGYLIFNQIHQLKPDQYNIIIGSTLAQQLSVTIHDQIRLTIPSINQITPMGFFPRQRLFTVSDIYVTNSEVDKYQVLIHQSDAAKLMNYPIQCVTGWRIWVSDPFRISQYHHDLFKISQKWHWKDWSDDKGSLFQAIQMEKNIMYVLFACIIIISSFNIISFLVLLITDKQKEIAILKTHGLTRLNIVSIFIIQSIFNSIFSIICGSVLGILLSKNLNQILFFFRLSPKNLQFPVEIQYLQIFSIDIIVCILIILITLYPAWYISSTQPAQVLRYD